MGNRRFAQAAISDDEDESPPPPAKHQKTGGSSAAVSKSDDSPPAKIDKKRKKITRQDEEDSEEREEEMKPKRGRKGRRKYELEEEDEEEEEEEVPQEDAKPIGKSIRFSGKGRGRRSHYEAFEFDGNQYNLEDPVLLVPEDKQQKPYVAIIKDIAQSKDNSMMVTGQWFYRPEEAERKDGGSWQSRDTRELFYSFHRDEVPAESVMHKCIVHFVPIHKQLPSRKQYPGFIVQKVYDTVEMKLWKLTDKDYEDSKQHEIDLLVLKTISHLGELPDVETDDVPFDHEEQAKKKTFKRRNMPPLDVTRDEEALVKSEQKPETPGSCLVNGSEYHTILTTFDGLSGDSLRDKWLERLLQGVQYVCSPADIVKEEEDDKTKIPDDTGDKEKDKKGVEKSEKSGDSFIWPSAAVPPVVALEQASHEALSSDFQKYNQKMRQLLFNLKNNALLARRLLNGELQPSKILSMSPHELKEGLTAEETTTKDTDDTERMQMTETRCTRCNEFKVGIRDIILAGNGDRYQLECTACGNLWYASRDEVSTVTTDTPNSSKSVGTAPLALATAKFETVEKLLSPRESDKSASEIIKKSTEAYMPVL